MLSKSEHKLIENKLNEKLTKVGFKYETVEITVSNKKLIFRFVNITHSYFKNVIILSHDSWFVENTLITKVEVRLRFLYNNRKNPVIGFNLCSFKLSI